MNGLTFIYLTMKMRHQYAILELSAESVKFEYNKIFNFYMLKYLLHPYLSYLTFFYIFFENMHSVIPYELETTEILMVLGNLLRQPI